MSFVDLLRKVFPNAVSTGSSPANRSLFEAPVPVNTESMRSPTTHFEADEAYDRADRALAARIIYHSDYDTPAFKRSDGSVDWLKIQEHQTAVSRYNDEIAIARRGLRRRVVRRTSGSVVWYEPVG
mgnify:CR=1 FL=1